MNEGTKTGAGIVGIGVAACAVCCTGPILAFLTGLGLAGLASTFLIGGLGLAIVATAIVAFVIVRRRDERRAALVAPVIVVAPVRRTPLPTESR